MGPPMIIFPGLPLKPPHSVIRSETVVPILTRRFLGSLTPGPVTVTTLSTRGLPETTASQQEKAVPTLLTNTPTSKGRPPEGTSLLRMALINCFSPHYYNIDDIYPLKKTTFENIEVYVPNNIEKVLVVEYGKNVLKPYYKNYIYKNNSWLIR